MLLSSVSLTMMTKIVNIYTFCYLTLVQLKSRDITLSTKVRLVKAMVFPVVMYGCESWTVKKAECRRIDAFELWCWRRLLSVPWTARRSNQSILKGISPGCSLEGLMLKLHPSHVPSSPFPQSRSEQISVQLRLSIYTHTLM